MKEGDRDAFSLLYKTHWPSLYNTAFKRTRNKEQCQDIVQNVLADLWVRRGTVEIENLAAYLHTAVRFQVFKLASRQPDTSAFLDSFEQVITATENADDPLREKEIANLINLFIAAIPEKRRTIFLMHYTEGLSTKEIAERLGISQKTVQNQLNTASQALRSRLTHLLSLLILLSLLDKN